MTTNHLDHDIDLELVQAHRQRHPLYSMAVSADSFDIFPHGNADSSFAFSSYGKSPSIVTGLLRSIDGGLPDYLIELLFHSSNEDDHALYDFLGIFDRRLLDLYLRVETDAIFVSQADTMRSSNGFIDRLSKLLGRKSRPEMLSLIPAMMVRGKNLETLRRILQWWTGLEVQLTTRFDIYRSVDPRSLTRINSSRGVNAALGKGAFIGRSGLTPQGRLDVALDCINDDVLLEVSENHEILEGLSIILDSFLSDPTPVQVFAKVKLSALPKPRLKGKNGIGTRLGRYNCFAPTLLSNETIKLKLDLQHDSATH